MLEIQIVIKNQNKTFLKTSEHCPRSRKTFMNSRNVRQRCSEHQNSSIFEGKLLKSNLKCKVGQAKKGIQDFFTLSMMSLLFDTKKRKKLLQQKNYLCI